MTKNKKTILLSALVIFAILLCSTMFRNKKTNYESQYALISKLADLNKTYSSDTYLYVDNETYNNLSIYWDVEYSDFEGMLINLTLDKAVQVIDFWNSDETKQQEYLDTYGNREFRTLINLSDFLLANQNTDLYEQRPEIIFDTLLSAFTVAGHEFDDNGNNIYSYKEIYIPDSYMEYIETNISSCVSKNELDLYMYEIEKFKQANNLRIVNYYKYFK